MPVGHWKTFGACEGAMKKKGYSATSAAKICGKIEQQTSKGKKASIANNVKYEEGDHFYIKAFLMDATENINRWGVHPNSIPQRISSAYGKPLVLTENFEHPMPPELNRVAEGLYDNDNNPYNIIKIDDIVEHWKAYQEDFRIGNIIDITKKNNGIYYAIIEVTDDAAKEAFRNNDLPLFVSPAIAQLDPNEDPSNISNWEFIHLAIVSNPAYTIKKALVTGQCHENMTNKNENGKCLLQLRQASVITTNKDNGQKMLHGCGFCRTKALARYASIVSQEYPEENAVNVNSSIDFLESQIELSSNMSEGNENNNNNNTQEVTEEETKKETTFDKIVKEKNPSPNPNKGMRIDPETGQPYKSSELVSKVADEVGVKVAGMEECVQIFTQNGVTPDQSVQICKLAAKALMENQQQEPQSSGDRPSPGISGQFGSQIADYEKEIAKQEVKIGQLIEELKRYRKDDKTDAQRIAELEETVSSLNKNLKEKELEAYLVTKISNEEQRKKKLTRFAELNMTLEDLKEIYEEQANTDPKVVKKTASVQVEEHQSPISRTKLRVASTQEAEESQVSDVRERNNRISSLLSKKVMV